MDKLTNTYRLTFIAKFIFLFEFCFWAVLFFIYFLSSSKETGSQQLMFGEANYLWLLLLIIPILFQGFALARRKNNRLSKVSPNLQQVFSRPVSSSIYLLKLLALKTSVVFLVICLAQPFNGEKSVKVNTKNLEMVIALDVSNSMNAKDIDKVTSRLDISKRAINQLINQLKGEKIGLVIFAGNAFVQLPITSDYAAAKLFVNDVESSMLSMQGTNINVALNTSAEMFSETKSNRSILLITDGENHEEDPSTIFEHLEDEAIHLSLMGIGTRTGGLVPNHPHRTEFGYKMDEFGNPVLTKLNVDYLKKIAKMSNGYLMISESAFPDLSEVLTQISKIKKTITGKASFKMKHALYPYFIILATLCLLTYLFSNFIEFKLIKDRA